MLTVLGTTTIDIFVRGIARMPERGDDEFSNSSLIWLDNAVVPALGGNGANAAYAAAALGEQVRLWSAIGTDPFGEMALGWLRRHNVEVSDLYVSSVEGTATTVILTDDALKRNSFHHPGSSVSFAPHRKNAGGAGDWLLLTSYPILPTWRGEAACLLLQDAQDAGVRTALDIGPILGDAVTRDELAPLLPFVDILFCNEFELGEVAGCEIEQGVAWALAAGVSSVVVKKGAQGATVCTSPQSESTTVPCFPVATVGTVGAGDSFDVGFLHAYSRGATMDEAARFANAVAAMVVSSPRGILDAPSRTQVDEFLKQNT